MFPRIELVTVKIPYQPPQQLKVCQLNPLAWRFSLVDRFGRVINFEGAMVGFSVRLFRSTDLHKLAHFVVAGDWDRALYRSQQGEHVEVEILAVERGSE